VRGGPPLQKCVVLRLFALHPQSSSTNARVATPHSSVASSSVAIAPSRQRTGVAGSESCPPPSPRCALRAMPWHRGCHSKHTPPLCHARIAQRDLELDFDPTEPEFEGPVTTFKIQGGACCASGAYDSSVTNECSRVSFVSASRWFTRSYSIFRFGKSTFLAHHRAVHGKPCVTAFGRCSRIDHCGILASYAALCCLTHRNQRFRRGQRTV
jgi:hypothetical protein